jgi:hypothetical protein|tara:strand:+ start:613 stop:1320 length:708 start_codon:yes stop_codon:yes gene_type:complete
MDKEQYINELLERDKQSSSRIVSQNLKDRFTYPYLPTMVVDNFYEEPDQVREYALSLEYFKGDRGSWPGVRTKLFHEFDQKSLDFFSKKLLVYLKDYGYTGFDEIQTAFHSTPESYTRGWVHDDDPKLNVAGVVYLNKEAPQGTGTVIYEDMDFDGGKYAEVFMQDVLDVPAKEKEEFNQIREAQVAEFKKTVTMESVYNRAIIFDTRLWHSPEHFYGNTIKDSRLTQVFFARAI